MTMHKESTKCDICGFNISEPSLGCVVCGLDCPDKDSVSLDFIYGWVGSGLVYLGITDDLGSIEQNISDLKKNKIDKIDDFYSVCGGGTWLHYLSTLSPEKLILFDINPFALEYTKLIVEIIGISNSREEFISRIYSKSLSKFENEHGVLNFNNQFIYLVKKREEDLYKDTLSKLSFNSIASYNKYLTPFTYRQNVGELTRNRIKNFIPCWEEEMLNPPVNNSGVHKIYGGNQKERNFPSTATLYYGHGWLESSDSFLNIKNKLNSINIEFRLSDSAQICCEVPLVQDGLRTSSVYHFSNIYDVFLEKEYNTHMNYLKYRDTSSGSALLASIHTIKGLIIHRDNRDKLVFSDHGQHVYELNHEKLDKLFRDNNVSSVLEIGCCRSDLSSNNFDIVYYCGIDDNFYELHKLAQKTDRNNFSFICSQYMHISSKNNIYDVLCISDRFCKDSEIDVKEIAICLSNLILKFRVKMVVFFDDAIEQNNALIKYVDELDLCVRTDELSTKGILVLTVNYNTVN